MTARTLYRLVLVLSALALAGSAWWFPAAAQAVQAAQARTISVVAPSSAPRGADVAVRGRITHTPKGLPVRVQRKVGTHWTTVRTSSTRRGGAFVVRIALPARAGRSTYRALAPGFEGLRPAVSAPFVIAVTRTGRA